MFWVGRSWFYIFVSMAQSVDVLLTATKNVLSVRSSRGVLATSFVAYVHIFKKRLFFHFVSLGWPVMG